MTDPLWLNERDAITLHDRLITLYGGAPGLRDRSLLQSVLVRPQQYYVYASDQTDMIKLSSLYTIGIIRNHPFVDGNKRLGFLMGVLFLEINGLSFIAPEEESAAIILALAASTLDEEGYLNFLRQFVISQ